MVIYANLTIELFNRVNIEKISAVIQEAVSNMILSQAVG
jgi:hypothetical protein